MKKYKGFVLLAALCCMLSGCGGQNDSNTETQPAAVTTPVIATEAVAAESLPSPNAETAALEDILSSMTLEEKVWQMFILTPDQLTGLDGVTQAGDRTAAALEEMPVGGLIYFAKNLETAEQTAAMLRDTQAYAEAASGIGLFLAVDEEGGTVARVADNLGTTQLSDMAVYGSINNATMAYWIGETIGRDIGALGFNLDFAPVADVDLCSGNELGDRIFSEDPEVVANMAAGVVRGLQEQGVAATLKHFPGLGAEDGNSHDDAAVVIDRSLEELRTAELIPFARGIDAGADFVMVGHQIVTGVGDDLPSDLSYKVVTELLRGELGFDGIAVTDSHEMNTIAGRYSSGEAAVMAVQAGMDIILMPEDASEAAEAICTAVEEGTIPEKRIDESLMRILREKQKLGLV